MKQRFARSFISAFAIVTLVHVVNGITGFPGAEAGEMRGLKIGQSFVYKLAGNPSTGYTWRVSAGESQNANILSIEDLGSSPPERPLLGAPQEHNFRVTASAAGNAKVVFEYVQPWIGKAEKRDTLTVEVMGE